LSFNDYWASPEFLDTRPVRNGSLRMLVGDNIYHRRTRRSAWVQADSHHSNPDGTPNPHNVEHDTQTDRVLISRHFYYFGRNAPKVPEAIFTEMGYTNVRDYRVFEERDSKKLISWLERNYDGSVGTVLGDPFNFEVGAMRYSAKDNKVR
jgi:hypothetical protein